MPHTSGWQTVPLAGPSSGLSEIDVQATSSLGGARVSVTPAESPLGLAFGEPAVHPTDENSLRPVGDEVAYSSDPFELLPRWLKPGSGPSPSAPAGESNRKPVVVRGERPAGALAAASGETIERADTAALGAAVSPEAAAAGTPEGMERPHQDIAAVKSPEPNEPDPIGEAPRPQTSPWQTGPLADPSKSVLDIDVQRASQLDAAKVAVTPVESSPGLGSAVQPAAETSPRQADHQVADNSGFYELLPPWLREFHPGSEANSLSGKDPADTGVTAGAAVSPLTASAAPPAAANPDKEETTERMAAIKPPGPNEPVPPQPKEVEIAPRSKTDLLANLENDTAPRPLTEEPPKPRGYITIQSEPEASRNQGTEDHLPKREDHGSRAQAYSAIAQERALTGQDNHSKAQEHPLKVPNQPPESLEKSADLRRFASAFLEADQTGNIAAQHRFYADSVHFYREGDLSWSGVAAATRRYQLEKQNTRYQAEGTATVTGPVNGGFYVVEQPVSWSRAEGSRPARGRSVLRIRVVPTNRGGWKITSIEEIGR
jgi:hypothetical protein